MVIDVKKLIKENKKFKEKKTKGLEKVIEKTLKGKIPSKHIIKPNKSTLTIKQKEIPSILNDENRFFKGEFENEKRLFFQ